MFARVAGRVDADQELERPIAGGILRRGGDRVRPASFVSVGGDQHGLSGEVRKRVPIQIQADNAGARCRAEHITDRQRQEHDALCYRRELMPMMRRVRGAMLRFVRHRALAMLIGLALVVPAAWVEFGGVDASWWLEGLSLIVGATGLALFWTGLTGLSPDWVE